MLTPEFKRKHAEALAQIQSLRLMDDDFMSMVFEDIPCAELLLQVILNREDLSVKEVKSQYEIKSIHGRSVRLDIHARDADGKYYDIEVQRKDDGAVPKRARYNSSLIDSTITKAGDNYNDLSETYVIFITENDVLKHNLPIYHIERTIQETGVLFDDGAHIVYVNGQIKDDTALGRLMHDFFCTNADDMYNPILASRVRYFKEEEKGVHNMCSVFEDIERRGRKEQALEVARRLLAMKTMSYTEIAAIAGLLSVEEVEALDKERLS